EITLETMNFGGLVERCGDRARVAARDLAGGGTPGLLDRFLPGAVQLHDLGAMNQAIAAEGDELRLRLAPCGECISPFAGAVEGVDALARTDDAAIDKSGEDGRDLAGSGRQHRLVEKGEPAGHVAQPDQGKALDIAREDREVLFAEAVTDCC